MRSDLAVRTRFSLLSINSCPLSLLNMLRVAVRAIFYNRNEVKRKIAGLAKNRGSRGYDQIRKDNFEKLVLSVARAQSGQLTTTFKLFLHLRHVNTFVELFQAGKVLALILLQSTEHSFHGCAHARLRHFAVEIY